MPPSPRAQEAVRAPECVCTGRRAGTAVVQGAHTGVGLEGDTGTHAEPGHVRARAAALHEAPRGPGPGGPLPGSVASLEVAAVTQGHSGSHQTGLRGEVSRPNLLV